MPTVSLINPSEDKQRRSCPNRYKSYPITHFSRGRYYFQYLICHLFIYPFVFFKQRPRIYGQKNVPRSASFILVANHISTLDPPIISYALDRSIAYMAKKELFKNVWIAEFYRSVGCFALDRDNPDSATLKTAFNVLRSNTGWVLGMFPEGTRSTTGKILPFKKGFGALACKTGTPILPVGICKDASGRFMVTIGQLMTDVSDADVIQSQVYDALVRLADPSWNRTK